MTKEEFMDGLKIFYARKDGKTKEDWNGWLSKAENNEFFRLIVFSKQGSYEEVSKACSELWDIRNSPLAKALE